MKLKLDIRFYFLFYFIDNSSSRKHKESNDNCIIIRIISETI